VPNHRGLEIASLLGFAKERPNVQKYIPDQWNHTDKEWLQNVLFSIATSDLDAFVESVCQTVRDKREEVKVQTAMIRPEFALALKEAKDFSRKSSSRFEFGCRKEGPGGQHGGGSP
jgi:hypothetical protein